MSTEAAFQLLPAIDLVGGRVVRLEQGAFDRETAYGDDPPGIADAFAHAGARWIHLVDLDGARIGTPRQLEMVAAIIERVGERMGVEVAGGLRSAGAVAAALALGASRVVLGTAAVRDPALIAHLIARHGPERIVVALDVRHGRARGSAWEPDGDDPEVDVALSRLADAGVETFEVTAIERDGLLTGPDLSLYERLVALGRGAVIASAGIASVRDLLRVRDVGCRGAIVGRAIYEGRLDLRDAVRELSRTSGTTTSPRASAQSVAPARARGICPARRETGR